MAQRAQIFQHMTDATRKVICLPLYSDRELGVPQIDGGPGQQAYCGVAENTRGSLIWIMQVSRALKDGGEPVSSVRLSLTKVNPHASTIHSGQTPSPARPYAPRGGSWSALSACFETGWSPCSPRACHVAKMDHQVDVLAAGRYAHSYRRQAHASNLENDLPSGY